MRKVALFCFFIFWIIAAAPAVLLDDFQGYGIGVVKEVASPPWIAVYDTNFAGIMTGPEGPYITWGWSGGTRGAALVLAEAGVNPISNASTAATVYFRFYVAAEAADHSFGMSDLSSGFSSFDNYETQVIVKDNNSVDGLVDLCIRNGSQTPVVDTIRVGQWYNLWMVIDQSSDRYDVYLTTDYTAATEKDRIARNIAFRNGTVQDLTSVLLLSYNQGQNVRISKITLNDGVNLAIPQEAQLLVNGHFEDGDVASLSSGVPGWMHWGGSTGAHHEEQEACFGQKGMKLWWNSSGMWQDFTATPDATYTYSVQVMNWTGDTSANNWDFQIEAEFYDAGNTQLAAVPVGHFDAATEPVDTWVKIGGAITAPTRTAYGRVVIRLTGWNSGVGGAIYFDNVSVIASSQPKGPDYNNDFRVNLIDFSYLSDFWKRTAPQYDLNGDNLLDMEDLAIFGGNWLSWQTPFGAETITINPAVTFQEIEGVGASLTDSSAWLIYEFLTPPERQAVLTDLFDPEEGIGLSYLRQPMGSSDFRLKDYSYNDLPSGVSTDYDLDYFSIAYEEDYIIPTLQEIRAINPDVRIMGSPWSPPLWMKTTGELSYGSLKSDVYDTYTNYFVKFIQAYAAHGISIDAVTPQNEPGHEGGGYGGCKMTPAEQIKLVKKMGEAFEKNDLSTKIIIWDFNWSTWFSLEVLADASVRPYIAGSAFHHYAGDISAQAIVHDAHPDKGIYFTEGSDSVKRDKGWNADLIRNGLFVIDAFRNWSRTLIKWNLVLDENNGPKIAGGCNTCYGVITINQATRKVTPRPQYYPLGHAGKFLRPGAVRIDSGSGGVKTVAFKNTDGSLVLYAVNPNSFGEELKLQWNSQWVISRIPGSSIMTFRWDNVPNAKVDVYLTTGDQTSLLEKRSPLYFHD